MTKKQQEILEFIKQFYQKNRRYPVLREICENFNLSAVSTVYEHLEKLERTGYIKKIKRGIYEIVNKEPSLPFYGYISAGYPIQTSEDQFEYVDVSDIFDCENCYALKVKGNSMIDEYILNGDIVIIENRNDVLNGEIAVVLIDNTEVTLKKVYFEGDKIKLVPANPEYKPLYFDTSKVRIQGVVRAVIRNYRGAIKRR